MDCEQQLLSINDLTCTGRTNSINAILPDLFVKPFSSVTIFQNIDELRGYGARSIAEENSLA